MKPVVWSPNAIESIQNSYDYIYSKSPQNANLVVRRHIAKNEENQTELEIQVSFLISYPL